MPEISIIVPVYKVEAYLDRCINSILNQTFKDFELILVDDGSPDRCPQMCDEWAKKDDRIKVIHKENGGLGSARNSGLDVAKGNYISFVDSDDWISKDMIEYLYNLLNLYPQAQIAQCGFQRAKSEKVKTIQEKEHIEIWDKKEMLDYFFRVNGEESNTAVWNKLIKASILKNFRFVLTLYEDVEASYEFIKRTDKIVCSNRKYYYYFKNPKGITYRKFTMDDLEYLNIWDKIVDKTKKEFSEYTPAAVFYRKRADMTMLYKMLISGYDRQDSRMCDVKRHLKEQLREHFIDLVRGNIPISRKVLLVFLII